MAGTVLPGLNLPVGNIYAIGRNYGAHARELGNAVPESPIVFIKPQSSLIFDGGVIELPPGIGRVDYETEVVIAIQTASRGVTPQRALDLIGGFAVGIDVTARDVQEAAKKKGLPWTSAKGRPTFAPLSRFVPANLPLKFGLEVNGQVKQTGDTSEMIFPIPLLISHIAHTYHLAPGDLIFTGTPAGVGALQHGDKLTAFLGPKLTTLNLTVKSL